jgi:hypothetical protein
MHIHCKKNVAEIINKHLISISFNWRAMKKTFKIAIPIIIIATIVMVVIIAGFMGQQPTNNVILDASFPIEPDTFHYQEFTVRKDGVLKIDMSCDNENGNLLWYLMDCDAPTFVNRGEDEFYDLTYKRNIEGQNPISDTIKIEAGTYTFIYIQTVSWISEQITNAKIVFSESSSTHPPTSTPTPKATGSI